MPFHLTSFQSMFPDVAAKETRSITLTKRFGNAPPGTYGFLEFYCEDPDCDCRNLIWQVHLLVGGKPVHVATVNHSLDPGGFRDVTGEDDTVLELFGEQTEMAHDILRLVEEVLLRDPAYRARLERHYEMVKERGRLMAAERRRRRSGSRRK
jgi:hypothetical protein